MGILLVLASFVAIYAALYLLAFRFRPLWNGAKLWFVCCVFPALVLMMLAFWAAAAEPAMPVDYDPMHDVNEGRWTFAILMVFGILALSVYVAVTTAIHAAIRARSKKP